jgi:hypothetical protein
MAVQTLTNVFFSINSNNLSDHVSSVALAYERETQDMTAMGDGTRINVAGLKNWSMEIEFNQDFANSNVDDLLFAIADAGAAVTCILRPDAGSVGANNPQYSGSGVVTSYNPLGSAVGDGAKTSISIVPAGTLTRSES